MESSMSTAIQLKKWAAKMGYVHPPNAPPCDFERLCKNPKTEALWKEVICTVKPQDECDHIRKNIVLGQSRHLLKTKNIVSGSVGQQYQACQELKLLKEEKKTTLEEVTRCESLIKDAQSKLRNKAFQKSLLENQLRDAQLKQQLFKMKKTECDSFLAWLQEVNGLARSHFPQSTNISEVERKNATDSLNKCVSVVMEYQKWKRGAESSGCYTDVQEFQANCEQRKVSLWHTVSAYVTKISPEHLWSCIMDLVEKSVSDMALLASSVDRQSDDAAIRIETQSSRQPSQDLSAMHIKALADVMEYLVKAEDLSRKLKKLIEETADDIEIKNATTDVNTSSVKAPRKNMLEYLRRQCRVIELEAAKQCLLEEVGELKKKNQKLFSFHRLKEEKASIARLDGQIAEAKKHVEQALLSVSDTKNCLKNVQKSVEEEVDKFARNHCVIIVNNGTAADNCNDIASSTAVSSKIELVASTPAPAHWSRGNTSCSSFADMTAIPLDSGTESISSDEKSFACDLRDVVASLKNAVSHECRTFIKLPLDLASKTKLASPELFSNDFESPTVIARTSKPIAQLCLSVRGVDRSQVLLSLFQNQGHIRAARIQQLAGTVPIPQLLADVSHQYLKATVPQLDEQHRLRLKNLETLQESTEGKLEDAKRNFSAWIEQPLQELIPETVQLHGMSFKQWIENYNSCTAQLEMRSNC